MNPEFRQTVIVCVLLAVMFAAGALSASWTEHTACSMTPSNPQIPNDTRSSECWQKINGNEGWRIVRMDKPRTDDAGAIFSLERPRIRILGG